MQVASFSIIRNALRSLPAEAKPSDRAVLMALGTFANSEGRGIWPKAATVARMTGLSRVAVFQCMARLKRYGALADDGMHIVGTAAVPIRRILIPGQPVPAEEDDPDDRAQENAIPKPPDVTPAGGMAGHTGGGMAGHTGGGMAGHTPTPIPPTPPFLMLNDQSKDSPLYLSEVPPQNGVTAAPQQDKGGKRPCRSPSGLAEIDSFQDFYSRYPRHVDRGHAEQMWNWALTHGATAREVIAGLERQLPSMQGREAKFIPHPGTWLRGKRWLDEAPPTWQEQVADVARRLSTTDTEAWFKPFLNGGSS